MFINKEEETSTEDSKLDEQEVKGPTAFQQKDNKIKELKLEKREIQEANSIREKNLEERISTMEAKDKYGKNFEQALKMEKGGLSEEEINGFFGKKEVNNDFHEPDDRFTKDNADTEQVKEKTPEQVQKDLDKGMDELEKSNKKYL